MNSESLQQKSNGISELSNRAYCYACFSKDVKPISEDLMTDFANAALPMINMNVEKSFVDTNTKKLARNRPSWNAMLEECTAENIKLIVVPAISMLSANFFDALSITKEIKKKYGVETYFLFEDIYTAEESVDTKISFLGLFQEYLENQKKQKKKFKKLFNDLTKGSQLDE